MDGYLICSEFGAIRNNTAMTIPILWYSYVCISVEYIPTSRLPIIGCAYIFNFSRELAFFFFLTSKLSQIVLNTGSIYF